MKLRFYNREGRWFADIPEFITQGGTENECEMVSGADTWLDGISNYTDQIWLEISDEPLAEKLTMVPNSEDEHGATYIAHEYKSYPYNHQLWLCVVTKFLFGVFPATIYYQITRP